MKNEVSVFCGKRENGRAVLLCSRCVQKLLIASPEKIAEMKRAEDVTETQLKYLNSLLDEEEIIHEYKKTRKFRPSLDRSRTGRKARVARA